MEDREILSFYSNIVETFENESPIVFDNDLANNILKICSSFIFAYAHFH